jgi:hypothetical protein
MATLTAQQISSVAPTATGNWASYIIDNGALIRLPGDKGGPQIISPNGGTFLSGPSDLFEDEGQYLWLTVSPPLVAPTASPAFTILGDLCGPAEKETCLDAPPGAVY